MCSTADIAFLLLIFFIVLAKGTREGSIDWKPAKTEAQMTMPRDPALTVIIDAFDQVHLDGVPVALNEVRFQAADVLEHRAGKVPGRRPQVLMKIHKESKAAIFQKVMGDLGELDVELFRVMEQEQPKPRTPGT